MVSLVAWQTLAPNLSKVKTACSLSNVAETYRDHGEITLTEATVFFIFSIDRIGSTVVSDPCITEPTVTFTIETDGIQTVGSNIRRTSISFINAYPTDQAALLTTGSKGLPTVVRVTNKEIRIKISAAVSFCSSSKDTKTT